MASQVQHVSNVPARAIPVSVLPKHLVVFESAAHCRHCAQDYDQTHNLVLNHNASLCDFRLYPSDHLVMFKTAAHLRAGDDYDKTHNLVLNHNDSLRDLRLYLSEPSRDDQMSD